MLRLQVNNLSKTYPSRTSPAVTGITLESLSKETLALVGPNGAGKTSLLRMIVGLVIPDEGTIELFLDGQKLESPVLRLFSDAQGGFYPRLSVLQNFRYFAGLQSAPPVNYSKVSAITKLRDFELFELMNVECQSLSRGQLQRLGLAIALSSPAHVLLLDEPTNGLDIEESYRFSNLIKDLANEGETIFVVSSHQPDLIASLASKILFIVDGKLSATTIQADDNKIDSSLLVKMYLELVNAKSSGTIRRNTL